MNHQIAALMVGVVLATVGVVDVSFAEETHRCPHIILFVADDHGWTDSGAYGDSFVRTPNIDRLATQGMRFTHAFAASPLCSPSRCVIATGLMPHRNGGHKFGSPIRADIKTMPEYLKERGYHTAHFGRFHHAPISRFPYDAMTCLVDVLPTCVDVAGGVVPKDLDGRSLLPILRQTRTEHRMVVFGSHTGNDNGGPGIANHCPARTIRTSTHRYVLNLNPETTFTTHITGCKSGPHYLPFWDSWVEKAKTDAAAKTAVARYQHRPREELYDLNCDPFEMKNLAEEPAHAGLVESLRRQLALWCEAQGDTLALELLTDLSTAPSGF